MRRFEAVLAFEAAPIDELAARAIDKVHLPGVRDESESRATQNSPRSAERRSVRGKISNIAANINVKAAR